jgi:hypothetical protein
MGPITPPRHLIEQWATESRTQGNPSSYIRQQFCNYGAQQMLERCLEILREDGDPLAARTLLREFAQRGWFDD